MARKLRAFDVFCGAGGSSWGAALAGVRVVGGVDSDSVAMDTYRANFPTAAVRLTERAEGVDLAKLRKTLGHVDLLLASPECTNHTHARGSAESDESSRRKAYQVVRYARALLPRWVIVENVVNMQGWSGYSTFIRRLELLGYHCRLEKLNASDFGVAQSRRRMFVICDREREPAPIPIPRRITRTARDIVELNGTYSWSPLRKKGRAEPTLERAKRAETALGQGRPFLLVYYGTDRAGGWQPLGVPLRTVTTIDRFAVVRWRRNKPQMRMLQVAELVRAMGFNHRVDGRRFRLGYGTRRDKVRLLGNAVCPPVMEYVVRSLTRS